MSSMKDINETAGDYWDRQLEKMKTKTITRVRWWEDPTTKHHINGIVGNRDLAEVHAAFHERIANILSGKRQLKALSVGCGAGTKEMWLMQHIDVAKFDLFDISSANIAFGMEEATRQGVLHKINFRAEDAFAADLGDDYDLVYWNNALHHMPDVDSALRWSRDRLKLGGLLAMDDFVGPSRFQWTDKNIAWANNVRRSLPERFLRNPYVAGTFLPREVHRPSPEEVIASDPSEAVDSGRIIAMIPTLFTNCTIIPTGGALYHLALNDIFGNFESEDDLALLQQILLLDQALAEHDTTQYAVAFGFKG